jgi:Histidine kinase-, DNA gyrase B-, and HSP90-like ATPase
MSFYADQIATLPLLDHLSRSAGRDGVSQGEVVQLTAMVHHAAETVGPLLKQIPLTFRQYTEHDIQHSRNLISLMGKFIPAGTLERLNAVELAILALSALLHDSGMFVTDAEKAAVLGSDEYRCFEAAQGERAALLAKARESGEHLRAAALQDALLAEYFRRVHPERAEGVVRTHLAGKLGFRGTDLTPAVLRVCVSHGWGVLESSDPRDPDKTVSRLSTRKPVSSVPVNEQYLACCLRLADIMDFDRSRTPASVFQHLGFTEEKSWEEWNKHLQVDGWHVDEHEVMYSAPCTHPAFYVAVMEFLDWIDTELRDCRHLVRETPKGVAERYELHLPPVVDRRQVEMEDRSYLAGAFRFQLDYERIMQLLMDRSLYPDPSLFLRELLQNALDACRTREAHAKAAGAPYQARIAVWDHSRDPDHPRIVFQDNGIGMSRRIVENYFMRVGRSYYQSAEFAVERQRLAEAGVALEATSQFGIGILSCFMVADRFTVETYRVGHAPLRIEIEGPTKYFTIQLLPEPERTDFPAPPASDADDGPPRRAGTRLTIHLRPGTAVDVAGVLDLFAVNVEYGIRIYPGGSDEACAINPWRWRDEEVKPSRDGKSRVARTEEGQAASVLDSILVPLYVPLDQYEFASYLDGRAWFWMLRGAADEPRPSRGYLQIGSELRCTGLAAFAGEMINLGRQYSLTDPKLDYEGLVERIELAAGTGRNPFDDVAGDYTGYFHSEARLWDTLSEDEQLALSRALTDGNGPSWYTHVVASESLLRGDFEWADTGVVTSGEVEFARNDEALALQGIRLPAGIVYWDPMTGSSRRSQFLLGRGGFAIDIRGAKEIKPAASRLFIESSSSKEVSLPLRRAFVQFGASLMSNADAADRLDWRRWFGEVVLPLFNDTRWEVELKELEFSEIERSAGYLCVIGEDRVVLSREELVAKYGSRVPVASWRHRKEGLVGLDRLNDFLVSHRHHVGPLSSFATVDMEVDLQSLLNRSLGR